MIFSTIHPDQLDKYQNIINSIIADDDILVIEEKDSEKHWNSLNVQKSILLPNSNLNCKVQTKGKTSIILDDGSDIATIKLFGKENDHQQQEFDSIIKILKPLLISEYQTQKEMNELAEELTSRYEEINLLLEKRESTGQNRDQRLQKILNSTAMHLDVETVALYLYDKDHTMSAASEYTAAHNTLDIDSVMATGRRLFQTSQDSDLLLFNGPGQKQFISRNDEGINQQLFFVRIKKDTHIDAILLATKASYQPKFSNSDKSILELLAKQINQLIYSHKDPITNLGNFKVMQQQYDELLTKIPSNHYLGLILISIDRFKILNDNLGREGGDTALREIARLLNDNLRIDDCIVRIESDTFAVLLHTNHTQRCEEVAERLCTAVREHRIIINNQIYDITASVGWYQSSVDTFVLNDAMANAESACQLAKELGRDRTSSFDGLHNEIEQLRENQRWVPRLSTALEEHRFVLFAQPIVPLGEGHCHFEVLLRLREDGENYITPGDFIPAAERYELMSRIDSYVINEAIVTLNTIYRQAPNLILNLSVNLSGQSLTARFADELWQTLKLLETPKKRLSFEITETAAISDRAAAIKFVERFKQLGCEFLLDDFGSGLSSFAYLKSLPVDYLKMDGSYVSTVHNDSISRVFVESINKIGHTMDLKTVAEYVSNPEIYQTLVEIGVDYVQGYHVGKPIALNEVADQLLKQHVHDGSYLL